MARPIPRPPPVIRAIFPCSRICAPPAINAECGIRNINFALWTLDFGLWTLDLGLRTLDFGLWTLDLRLSKRQRSLKRWIFPVAVFGNSSTNSIQRGRL